LIFGGAADAPKTLSARESAEKERKISIALLLNAFLLFFVVAPFGALAAFCRSVYVITLVLGVGCRHRWAADRIVALGVGSSSSPSSSSTQERPIVDCLLPGTMFTFSLPERR
jgi:hypothetical protein